MASACKGVVVALRRSQLSLNTMASKAAIIGKGIDRRWKVYTDRRRKSLSFSLPSHMLAPPRP